MKSKPKRLFFQQQFAKVGQKLCLSTILFFAVPTAMVKAQITPDGSLSTTVQQENNTLNINGGEREGNNLFHSFEAFSVPERIEAVFENALDIENIFSRITGESASSIEGLLSTQGAANFFLVNPNGIVFGENAQLDVGGSFIATTANSIQFEDNTNFTAKNAEEEPILTVSVPIGLNLGADAGDITVQGTGNNLSLDPELGFIVRDRKPAGLQVDSDRTLALVGGKINIEGGNLTAPGGRIELGSIGENGLVDLSSINSGWTLGYENVINFQDILLSQAASVDVSSDDGSGNIQVQGKKVTVQDRSTILATPLGNFSGNNIAIKASEAVEISGDSPNNGLVGPNTLVSTVSTDVQPGATGDAGNLTIETKIFRVVDGGQIGSGTYGVGDGATLSITAQELEVSGATQFRSSGIFNSSEPGATGNGGGIKINTEQLRVVDGANIVAATFGVGNSGNINITAQNVEIIEGMSNMFPTNVASGVDRGATGDGGDITINTEHLRVADGANIFSGTLGDSAGGDLTIETKNLLVNNGSQVASSTQGRGNGGDLTIETENLLINNEAQISSGTSGAGNAGNIDITAQNIEVVGSPSPLFTGIFSSSGSSNTIPGEAEGEGNGGNLTIDTRQLRLLDGGIISADAMGTSTAGNLDIRSLEKIELLGPSTFLGVSAIEGDAGNLTLETKQLTVADGSLVTVDSISGETGNLQIMADSLLLDQSTLSAITRSSNRSATGGNITLQIAEDLQLGNESQINASALESNSSDGGNVTISTNSLIAKKTSQVTASAVQGRGGNIDIDAEGAFLFDSSANIFSASSELGIDGQIQISTPDIDFQKELEQSELEILTAEQAIAKSCLARNSQQANLTIGSNGGLPKNPNSNYSDANFSLTGVGSLPSIPREAVPTQKNFWQRNQSLIPAEKMVSTEGGRLFLVTAPKKAESPFCSPTEAEKG